MTETEEMIARHALAHHVDLGARPALSLTSRDVAADPSSLDLALYCVARTPDERAFLCSVAFSAKLLVEEGRS